MSVTERHHTHIIKTGLKFGHLEAKYNPHNSLTGHKANHVCAEVWLEEQGCVRMSLRAVGTPGLRRTSAGLARGWDGLGSREKVSHPSPGQRPRPRPSSPSELV